MRLLRLLAATSLVGASGLGIVGAAGAATAPSVSALALINADTDKTVSGYSAVADGATLDLAKLPTTHLNLEALSTSAGSIEFQLDGARVRVQNSAPFTLGGDDGSDYYAWTPSVGTHTVKATPYSGVNLGGTKGTAKTITFTVTKGTTAAATRSSPVSALTLINADTDKVIAGYSALADGVTLNLAQLPTPRLNISAIAPSTIKSMSFDLDGKRIRVQNSAPYTLGGDDGSDFYAWTPALGAHTLTVTPYTGTNLGGTKGVAKTLKFTATKSTTATPPPVTPAPSAPDQVEAAPTAPATPTEPITPPLPTEPITPTQPTEPTQPPPPTVPTPATRTDLALRPFSLTSPWNTPVSSGASYGGSGDARTTSLPNSTYINAGAYSIPVVTATNADPLTTIASPQGTITIHAPADATNAAGSDGNLTVVDPTHQFVDEFWIAQKTGTNTWSSRRHVRSDLNGPGIGNGIRAAGFSVMAGLIRDWEVSSGSIDHALVMVIPSSRAKQGWVWPAISEDSYASYGYTGSIPLGTRFAIPRSVNLDGLGLTREGLILGRALQNYGSYVGDTGVPGAGGSTVLAAEPSLEGSTALSNMRTDLTKLRAQLRPVG